MYIESYSNKKIKNLKEIIRQIPSVYLRSPDKVVAVYMQRVFKAN